MQTRHDIQRTTRQSGFSIIELMASLIVLVIVIAGMTQFLYLGRQSYDDEERKRTATQLGNRLLEDRRSMAYTALLTADTTITIDGVSYRTVITAQSGVPTTYLKRVRAVTSWSSKKGTSRNVTLSTFLSNHP